MSGYGWIVGVALVAGAGLVAPAAIGRWTAGWRVVAASTALALMLSPRPVGAALALVWLFVAAAGLALEVWAAWQSAPADRSLERLAALAVAGWSVVAGLFLVDTSGGLGWSGYGEPITRLTAVHFTYAGVGTTAMAAAAFTAQRRTWRGVGLVTVVVAPALVATGFMTGLAAFEVGGPIVMAAGAYLVGAANLADGWRSVRSASGRLLLVSGASVLVPMVLAVSWALAPHTGGPALSIPDMVRFHGGLQAAGFVGCGLAGRWLAGSRSTAPEEVPPPLDRTEVRPEVRPDAAGLRS